MRIIAGSARGKTLLAPRGSRTRPTPARVREALFALVAAHLPAARVLDLFAGSGALGLEALSRGAASAVFVDFDTEAICALRRNLGTMASRATVLPIPATAALRRLASSGQRFDLIFLDPPYAGGLLPGCLQQLVTLDLLTREAVVTCEYHRLMPAPAAPAGLRLARSRCVGDTCIGLFVPSLEPA